MTRRLATHTHTPTVIHSHSPRTVGHYNPHERTHKVHNEPENGKFTTHTKTRQQHHGRRNAIRNGSIWPCRYGAKFALNVAEKGFTISVCNRSPAKVDTCMARAQQELGDDAGNMRGFKDKAEFVASLKKPRRIMFLVKAGPAVDETIKQFTEFLEEGDILIDGGNEWYQNSIRRAKELEPKELSILPLESPVERRCRNGPSLMPGGKGRRDVISPIFKKCAAIHTGK